MKYLNTTSLCSTLLLVSACAYEPMGPTVRAMPAQGKPFEQFQYDQSVCKQYAYDQVRGQAEQANTRGVLTTLGGAALGAGLGAAVGGGEGAGIGAAGGAIAGTAVGASTSSQQQRSIQEQYNDAYAQCMSSKGNKIESRYQYVPQPRTTVIYQNPPPPTVIYTQPPPQPYYAY